MLPISRCNSAGFRLMLGIALLLITWQSLVPNPVPAAEVIGDKVLHALGFLLLGFLADAGWPNRPFDWRKFAPLGIYGLGIEGLQALVPGRVASLGDLLADAAGLVVYGLIAWVIGRRMRMKAETVD
jgi:VanZ family protein